MGRAVWRIALAQAFSANQNEKADRAKSYGCLPGFLRSGLAQGVEIGRHLSQSGANG